MANPILPVLLLAAAGFGLVQYDKGKKAKASASADKQPKPLPPVEPGKCLDDATCAATLSAFLPPALLNDVEALEAFAQLAGKMGQFDLARYIARRVDSLKGKQVSGQSVPPAPLQPPPAPPLELNGVQIIDGTFYRFSRWTSPNAGAWTFDGWSDYVWITPGLAMTKEQVASIASPVDHQPPPFIYQQAWLFEVMGVEGSWVRAENYDLRNFEPTSGEGPEAVKPLTVKTWEPPPGLWDLDALPDGQTLLFPMPIQNELHDMSDEDARHFIWMVRNTRDPNTIRAAAGYFKLAPNAFPQASFFLTQLAAEIEKQGKAWYWDINVPTTSGAMRDHVRSKFGV